MKNLRMPLRVVFYRDGADWVAHCLEFDLMGDGTTKKEALDQLTDAINIQVEASIANDNPENLFSPAEGKFFAMFAAAKKVVVGEMQLRCDSVVIDEAETREFEPDPSTDFALA